MAQVVTHICKNWQATNVLASQAGMMAYVRQVDDGTDHVTDKSPANLSVTSTIARDARKVKATNKVHSSEQDSCNMFSGV